MQAKKFRTNTHRVEHKSDKQKCIPIRIHTGVKRAMGKRKGVAVREQLAKMAGYASYYQWVKQFPKEQVAFPNDVEDGNMAGTGATFRVDIDPLLLLELKQIMGTDLSDQTICRHAIALLVGYPSYAACSRQEHYPLT